MTAYYEMTAIVLILFKKNFFHIFSVLGVDNYGWCLPVDNAKIRNLNPVCQAFQRLESNAGSIVTKCEYVSQERRFCIQLFNYSDNF